MEKKLFLEDLSNHSEKSIKEHLINYYTAKKEDIERYEIIVAYESVGDYGCDSSSFFLLKDIVSGKLYEVHGSHCSCHGFENQFNPEETDIYYLKSEKFSFSLGGHDSLGYDEEEGINLSKTKKFLKENL
jgi:hypothetical protein